MNKQVLDKICTHLGTSHNCHFLRNIQTYILNNHLQKYISNNWLYIIYIIPVLSPNKSHNHKCFYIDHRSYSNLKHKLSNLRMLILYNHYKRYHMFDIFYCLWKFRMDKWLYKSLRSNSSRSRFYMKYNQMVSEDYKFRSLKPYRLDKWLILISRGSQLDIYTLYWYQVLYDYQHKSNILFMLDQNR